MKPVFHFTILSLVRETHAGFTFCLAVLLVAHVANHVTFKFQQVVPQLLFYSGNCCDSAMKQGMSQNLRWNQIVRNFQKVVFSMK